VKPLAVGSNRVFERAFKAGHEFAFAPRQSRHTAIAFGPIPRRQVEQRLRKAIAVELRHNLGRREVIGKEKLDARKACRSSSGKPIEETHLLEHEAQICRKLWHRNHEQSQDGFSVATWAPLMADFARQVILQFFDWRRDRYLSTKLFGQRPFADRLLLPMEARSR
jgi:hypothetical protein